MGGAPGGEWVRARVRTRYRVAEGNMDQLNSLNICNSVAGMCHGGDVQHCFIRRHSMLA